MRGERHRGRPHHRPGDRVLHLLLVRSRSRGQWEEGRKHAFSAWLLFCFFVFLLFCCFVFHKSEFYSALFFVFFFAERLVAQVRVFVRSCCFLVPFADFLARVDAFFAKLLCVASCGAELGLDFVPPLFVEQGLWRFGIIPCSPVLTKRRDNGSTIFLFTTITGDHS